jgi:hypothetical protein
VNRSRPIVTLSGLRRAFADVGLAVLCLAFAYGQLWQFAQTHRPSAPLLVAAEIVFAAFALFRRPAEDVSASPRPGDVAEVTNVLARQTVFPGREPCRSARY